MKRFFSLLYRVNELACRALLVALVLVVSFSVFGRYVLGWTPAWGVPVASMAMIAIAFLGTSLGVYDESHLKLTLIDLVLPVRVIRWIDRVHTVLVFGFGVLLVYYGIRLADLGRLSRIPGIGIRTFWFYIIVPIAGFVLAVHCLERLSRPARTLKSTAEQSQTRL